MAGGVCMAGGGMRGGGHAWQGGVHVWWGACMAGGIHGGGGVRYYEIRSMSGRYASYWNAFLFNM